MKISVVWLCAALMLTGCASSEQQTASNPQQVKCKRETTTGSHTSRRVCRTVAQIDAEREAARRTMDQRRGLSTGSGQ
jgi:uncharacterized protein YcfL